MKKGDIIYSDSYGELCSKLDLYIYEKLKSVIEDYTANDSSDVNMYVHWLINDTEYKPVNDAKEEFCRDTGVSISTHYKHCTSEVNGKIKWFTKSVYVVEDVDKLMNWRMYVE